MLRSTILRKHWDNLWSSKGNTFGIKQCLGKLGENACWKIYKELLETTDFHKFSKLSIIELGSGSGGITKKLLYEYPDSYAMLVDYSKTALDYCERNTEKLLLQRMQFVQADILEYASKKKYNLIHSGGLIEHFSGILQDTVIQKHLALCADNGYVIIMVPAPVWWYKIVRRIFETLGKWPQDFETALTLKELKNLCEKNGINVYRGIQSAGLARASAIIGVKLKNKGVKKRE